MFVISSSLCDQRFCSSKIGLISEHRYLKWPPRLGPLKNLVEKALDLWASHCFHYCAESQSPNLFGDAIRFYDDGLAGTHDLEKGRRCRKAICTWRERGRKEVLTGNWIRYCYTRFAGPNYLRQQW